MTVGFYLGFLLLHRVSNHCGSGSLRTLARFCKGFQNFRISGGLNFGALNPKPLQPFSAYCFNFSIHVVSVTVVISVSRVNIVVMIIVMVMVIGIGTVIVTFFVFRWLFVICKGRCYGLNPKLSPKPPGALKTWWGPSPRP